MDHKQFLYEDFEHEMEHILPEAQPKWGLMTAQHLLEHFSMLFLISNGRFEAPSFYPEERQAINKQYFFEKKTPFRKNFDPSKKSKLEDLRFPSFEVAKAKLLGAYQLFKSNYEENTEAVYNHPVMGKLTKDEWTEFHARHILYHLMQFGLKEEDSTIVSP